MSDDPIRLTGVRFARGGRTIFDGLDLTIPLGRSTALVAPSGAGSRPCSPSSPDSSRPTRAW